MKSRIPSSILFIYICWLGPWFRQLRFIARSSNETRFSFLAAHASHFHIVNELQYTMVDSQYLPSFGTRSLEELCHESAYSRIEPAVNHYCQYPCVSCNLRGVMLPRAVILTHLSSSASAANITEEMLGFSVQVSSIVHMLGVPSWT